MKELEKWISGKGKVVIDGETIKLKAGDCV